ncbi:hypothetical protein LTR53_011443 [Teratosphaeriaceae sp. CCFEE 6253]|nr:hypothetical protein LTR53_011443 [Teratosphaeriaceae sp. CCFEE 6253]
MDSAIIRAAFTAATLSGISNFLAQCITCYHSNPQLQIQAWPPSPSTLTAFASALRHDFDPTDLLHFFLFSLLACPPNYLWQKWLEGQFPGYTQKLSSTPTPQKEKREEMSEKSVPSNPATAAAKAEKKLNITNTLIKFALDQTLGAAANTVLFIAGIALLRGQDWGTAQQNVAAGFWPMLRAGQRLWPFVSVAQFTVVPFEWRTLVGSMVGLVWGVMLALMSSPKAKVA